MLSSGAFHHNVSRVSTSSHAGHNEEVGKPILSRFHRTAKAFEATFHIKDFTFDHTLAFHLDWCWFIPISSQPRYRNRSYADFTETPPSLLKGHLRVLSRGLSDIDILSTSSTTLESRTWRMLSSLHVSSSLFIYIDTPFSSRLASPAELEFRQNLGHVATHLSVKVRLSYHLQSTTLHPPVWHLDICGGSTSTKKPYWLQAKSQKKESIFP